MKRNPSIDVIKGILIILVIIGHMLLGGVDDNLARYIIYSFHMPVFMFISGYLLNIDTLRSQTMKDFLSKYWRRYLKEWSIAWLVYTTAFLLYTGPTIKHLLLNIYNPYYHLWFIPSLFLMIILIRIVFKSVKSDWLAYVLLLGFGVLLFNLSSYYDISQAYNCRLLPFLVLGVISRYYSGQVSHGWWILVLLCVYLSLIISIFFSVENPMWFYRSYIQLPLCALFCILICLPMLKSSSLHNGILEYIGRHSLRIYLWHVVPIIVLKKIFAENTSRYYFFASILLLLFIVLIYSLSRKDKFRFS